MIPTLVTALTLAAAYWCAIRRWMRYWGTTSSDLTRVMAGDDLVVVDPTCYTMAVIVNARPEHIWPWLVQMGYQRGGLYSYDWLDRLFGFLDRPSATRILPEFQHLAVGDKIPLPHGQGYPVAAIEPGRALGLDMRNMWGFDWVWQFGLYPVDEKRTRLGLVMIGLMAVPIGLAQTQNSSEKELIGVENAWKQAVVKRDAPALQRLYADEYMSTQQEEVYVTDFIDSCVPGRGTRRVYGGPA